MVQRLEQTGELENTLIVIAGDNGMPFPRCKATLYDTGTRVPLIVHWPAGAKGHRRIDEFVSLTDLAPTFLEVAGIATPDRMTGRSLMPILNAKLSQSDPTDRSFVLTGMERHVYLTPSRAIRTKRFLYIRNFDAHAWPMGETKHPAPQIDFTDGSWPSFPGAFSFNIDPSPTKQFVLKHRNDPKFKVYFTMACGKRSAEELYDLTEDPDQLHNVAMDADYMQQLVALRNRLQTALQESSDPRFTKTQP